MPEAWAIALPNELLLPDPFEPDELLVDEPPLDADVPPPTPPASSAIDPSKTLLLAILDDSLRHY
ncbi:MAG: hypothetical protein ACR2QH_12625 [Geminicoccaceae bacterium]